MNKEILIGEKILHHSDIERITTDIANRLDQRLSNDKTLPVVVGILKGGAPFMCDIVRKMKTIVDLDFMDVSSYSGTKSTGKINIKMDLSVDVTGKEVVIIDDVIDTGLTSYFLDKYLIEKKKAKSLINVFLINKTPRRKYDVKVDYCGLTYDQNKFLIGYGLDYNGLLRNIFAVYAMAQEDIEKLDAIAKEDASEAALEAKQKQ